MGVGEVDALALEHALRQGLGHFLWIGRIAHLLQFQAYPGDAIEERGEAQALGVFALFADQGQQGAEGFVQGAGRSG
ncbi:hypothetical protein D3C85_1628670 [compost metagenome]